MKLTFTNGAGDQSEIEIQGKCKITDYDTRYKSPEGDDLTVDVDDENVSIMNGTELKQDSQTVTMNANKYSIFTAIAGADGNNKTLTQEDIAIAKDASKSGGTLWDTLSGNGVTEIRYDKRAGVATIVIGDKELLRIDFKTWWENLGLQKDSTKMNETESQQESEPGVQLSESFSVLGESGLKLTEDVLNNVQFKRSQFDKKFLQLFDLYNAEGAEPSDTISANQLKSLLEDLFKYDKNGDKAIGPVEIRKFLKERGIKDLSVSDVIALLNKIVETSHVKNLCNSKRRKLDITNVPPELLTSVLEGYRTEKGASLVKNLYKSSNKTKNLNALRDGLVSRAEQCNLNQNLIDKFKEDFEKASEADELDSIVEAFLSQLAPKEKLYCENKDGIINMMAGVELDGNNTLSVYSADDFNAMAEKIIYYANKYRPEDVLGAYSNSSNSAVKKLANGLLKSGLLDYWPIYVASIVAQETGFRESDNPDIKKGSIKSIYTGNGRGVMQLTLKAITEMYANPQKFDEELINRIKKEYPDSKDFYDKVINQNDDKYRELQYELGVLYLRNCIGYALDIVERGNYKTNMSDNPNGKFAVIDNPTKLLETTARLYNGNSNDSAKDPVYNNRLVKVDRVYARNVILRFKERVPDSVQTDPYYEWNPIKNIYVIKK